MSARFRGRGFRGVGRKQQADTIDNLSKQLADVSQHSLVQLPTGTVVDFSGVELKPDHDRRPFWVTPIGRIFLEGQLNCWRVGV